MRAMELALQGSTQRQIANELGVSQAAVSKILHRVEVRATNEQNGIRGRLKARYTLRLEHLYAEAMTAWERSKTDMTRRRQRKTQGGAQGSATIAELVVENQHGDPRYLEQGRKALADLTKLWGHDAPQAVNTNDPTASPYWAKFADLSDEEYADFMIARMRDVTAKLIRLKTGKRVPAEMLVVESVNAGTGLTPEEVPKQSVVSD
jgi:DNA-binding MarR family transcriptional regulator